MESNSETGGVNELASVNQQQRTDDDNDAATTSTTTSPQRETKLFDDVVGVVGGGGDDRLDQSAEHKPEDLLQFVAALSAASDSVETQIITNRQVSLHFLHATRKFQFLLQHRPVSELIKNVYASFVYLVDI